MKPTRDDPTAVGTSEVADAVIERLGVRVRCRRHPPSSAPGTSAPPVALELARSDYADVVLVDIIPNFPQGKALDMNQAGLRCSASSANILGTNGYEETEGSDVIVITAGKPRSPGMSRDDLVTTNEAIVGKVTREAVKRSRDAIVIVVSNPLDAMCHVAKAASRFKRHRVVGMAGILDTARFSAFIAWETGASVKDVTAMVLGGHGDQMVPVVSATTVGGVPIEQLIPRARINELVKRTATGGGEIVNLLGTSAWYTRARRRRRWSTRSCSTRSACSRARPTSRASTASVGSTWACRASSVQAGSRRSSSSGSPPRRSRSSRPRRPPCETSSRF